VLALHIAGMTEDGEKNPKPSKIDDLAEDPDRKGAVAFLVSADFHKAKTVRVNVTARENQIKLIDRLAGEAGMTRSAYMVQSATSGLSCKERTRATKSRMSVASRRAGSREAKER
jgi:hypothetical protein